MKRASMWKLVGLAWLAGVAATGVAVARSERQRRSYTPEEVRARLHDRVATMDGGPVATQDGQAEGRKDSWRGLGRGLLGRHRAKRG